MNDDAGVILNIGAIRGKLLESLRYVDRLPYAAACQKAKSERDGTAKGAQLASPAPPGT